MSWGRLRPALRPFVFRHQISSFGYSTRTFSARNAFKALRNPGLPLLARYPKLFLLWQGMKYAGGLALTYHILSVYFYSLEQTWGISMLPNLRADGGWVLISRYYRRGRGVQVGDVVVFAHPLKEDGRAVKRVIGMPGDYVLRDSPHTARVPVMIQVPAGHCYVVGDNLDHSRDSRMFGPLPLALVKGKIVASYEPSMRDWMWFKQIPGGLQEALDWEVEDDELG